MITLSVIVYIVWTIARFVNRHTNNWTKFGYDCHGAWYAHLWDIAHYIAIVVLICGVCIKYFI